MARDEAEGLPDESGTKPRRIWAVVIGVAAVALAGFLLYRTLSRYSFDQLVDAVTAIPVAKLLAAGGFAALSYACLTFFDYFGLRYAGRPLAYPKAALASFTSLSLGHNIGFAALSSGAVRYRFYSRWGLSTEQVAKVILFCGLTVGLGLMVLGGAALLLRADLAEEMTGLSRTAILAIGAVSLALPTVYLILAATVRGTIRIRRWSLQLPRLKLALAQLVVGPLNFGCVAACLHQALSAVTDVGYLGVASAYVIANTTALISHVPGGLGVIESVVMYLLPQADLIGALLVFRFVYFLVPLAMGGLLFLATEFLIKKRRRGAEPALQRA